MLAGPLPPTDQLLGFITVARHSSFTKAAAELGLSQPALSRQIQGLERQLGVRLFDRVGRSVRLTALGEELENRVAPLLEELSRVSVNLASSTGSAAGRVRLGASESVTAHVLPGILRPFITQNRRVDLRLLCATSEHLPVMVASGELDLAVTSVDRDCPGLQVTHLWDDELVLVLPMGHPSRSRSIRTYTSEDFILLDRGTSTRRLLDRSLADLDLELKVVLEHSSTEVIKAMVVAGMGLAILPEPAVRREARRGELAAWPLTDLTVVRPIVAIQDPRRDPWPAEVALLNALTHFGRPRS
jgi:DNA-binding transcriptional LysR family regulator